MHWRALRIDNSSSGTRSPNDHFNRIWRARTPWFPTALLLRLKALFLAVRSLCIPTPPPPLWAGRIYLWSKSQRIQIVIGGYGRSPTPSSMKKNSLMGRF
jgi:hypothetical protein